MIERRRARSLCGPLVPPAGSGMSRHRRPRTAAKAWTSGSPLVAQLLWNRGVRERTRPGRFLTPERQPLGEPQRMSGVAEGVGAASGRHRRGRTHCPSRRLRRQTASARQRSWPRRCGDWAPSRSFTSPTACEMATGCRQRRCAPPRARGPAGRDRRLWDYGERGGGAGHGSGDRRGGDRSPPRARHAARRPPRCSTRSQPGWLRLPGPIRRRRSLRPRTRPAARRLLPTATAEVPPSGRTAGPGRPGHARGHGAAGRREPHAAGARAACVAARGRHRAAAAGRPPQASSWTPDGPASRVRADTTPERGGPYG